MATYSEAMAALQQLKNERDTYRRSVVEVRKQINAPSDKFTEDALAEHLAAQQAKLAEQDAKIIDLTKRLSGSEVKPGDGGTIIGIDGFKGRKIEGLDPYWNKGVFEEDFPKLSEKFLTDYGKWLAYPENFFTTNAKGTTNDHYSTNNMFVRDITLADGSVERCLVCTLRAKRNTPDGKNHGAAPYPAFNVGHGTAALKDYCIQVATGVSANVDGWHKANLWWNDLKPWPKGGEDDYDECSSPWNCEAFYHLDGATAGSDQIHFSTRKSQVGQLQIIRAENIAGKSFKLFCNDVQVKPDNFDALLKQGLVDANGTIIKRVNADPKRLVLQNEPEYNANPPADLSVYYGWLDIRTHAA